MIQRFLSFSHVELLREREIIQEVWHLKLGIGETEITLNSTCNLFQE